MRDLCICSGYVPASRKACLKSPTLGEIAPGVISDDYLPHAGIGQGCSCANPFFKCTHEGTATFSFKQIGTKILKVCENRGTNADALLRGVWTWKEALAVIKGPSDLAIPWMQLRRTLFALEENNFVAAVTANPLEGISNSAQCPARILVALMPPNT